MTYLLTDDEKDTLQRLLDPCNPMDFLWFELRRDYLESCFKLRCDPAA